jgi:hypothetical protein
LLQHGVHSFKLLEVHVTHNARRGVRLTLASRALFDAGDTCRRKYTQARLVSPMLYGWLVAF